MRAVDTSDQAPEKPAGVLVLGLWVEPSCRVVVRITRSTGLQQKPEESYASTKNEVLLAVERWLDAFVTPP